MIFNIRISIVSPYFKDIWHIFHDRVDNLDIVLVCNGRHFGNELDNITHCTATIGAGVSWRCVGADQQIDDIGFDSRHSEGRKTAIDLFTVTLNRDLLFKTRTC